MTPYLERMKEKTPHERRQHAAGIAATATVVVALAWMSSLAYYLPMALSGASVAQESASSQFAGVLSSGSAPKPALEVSTTSVFSN